MSNWFKKDLKSKIAAFLTAVLFWLYVSNVSNPFQTVTIYNVPITIENQNYLEENGYKLKNTYRSSIDITIRGRKDAVEKVKAGDFETTLDFSQIQSVNDKKLYISDPVCTNKDVTIESYSPSAIDIQLARNKSKKFEVELKSNIAMKPGYVLVGTTMTDNTVNIISEETIIDSVDSIQASLDIKDLDRDMTQQIQCKVYNKEGKDISNLFENVTVTVKLEVAKEVPVSLVTRGRLATDFIETKRVIEPIKALIKGPADILASITEIKTEQVDITGIVDDFTATAGLVVPEGVKLVNTPNEVAVNISVEKLIVREIEIASKDISVLNAVNDGSLTYNIKTEKLLLQFKGRQADVNALRLENLKLGVDVTGLQEGSHKLQLNLTIPSTVKLLQKDTVEVIISKTGEPQEPVTTP